MRQPDTAGFVSCVYDMQRVHAYGLIQCRYSMHAIATCVITYVHANNNNSNNYILKVNVV